MEERKDTYIIEAEFDLELVSGSCSDCAFGDIYPMCLDEFCGESDSFKFVGIRKIKKLINTWGVEWKKTNT